MLNNTQAGQSRNRMDAGLQQAGNGDAAKMAPAATEKRQPEPTPSNRPRKAASSDAQAATTTSKPPTHDEIAARAFQVYVKKGRPEGRDTENWLEAESELHRERGIRSAKR